MATFRELTEAEVRQVEGGVVPGTAGKIVLQPVGEPRMQDERGRFPRPRAPISWPKPIPRF